MGTILETGSKQKRTNLTFISFCELTINLDTTTHLEKFQVYFKMNVIGLLFSVKQKIKKFHQLKMVITFDIF